MGSSIFRLLGIPAQETRLGTFTNGKTKVVCACRDFTRLGLVLHDFCSIKNTVIDSETGGTGTELDDVLATIDMQAFVDPVVVRRRFWEMFVVDALLENFDRHNGNWGFLVNVSTGESELAPVFDCGSCLLPQADDSIMQRCLENADMSTLSFHATKVFNTVEGGALVCRDEATKRRIDDLKNFGFHGETEVVAPGINSKMDEMRAVYGLLNLKQVDAAIEARHQVAMKYREALRNVEGISFFDDMEGIRHNYSYFPIFVDAEKYGMTRDELYFKMKEQYILSRRYFYPLISTFTRSLNWRMQTCASFSYWCDKVFSSECVQRIQSTVRR